MQIIRLILIITWIALAAGATLAASRTTLISLRRRVALILLAWALPVIGALLTFYFLRRSKPQRASTATSDTMSIDVLAAGTADSLDPSEHDPR